MPSPPSQFNSFLLAICVILADTLDFLIGQNRAAQHTTVCPDRLILMKAVTQADSCNYPMMHEY